MERPRSTTKQEIEPKAVKPAHGAQALEVGAVPPPPVQANASAAQEGLVALEAQQPAVDLLAVFARAEAIERKYEGIRDRFNAEMCDLAQELVPGENTADRWLERANVARARGMVDLIGPCSWQHERMTRFGKQSG